MSSEKLDPRNRRVWVVKVRWVKNLCEKCKENLIYDLGVEGLTKPTYLDSEFMAPYQYLEIIMCLHSNSPHLGQSCIESVYAKR